MTEQVNGYTVEWGEYSNYFNKEQCYYEVKMELVINGVKKTVDEKVDPKTWQERPITEEVLKSRIRSMMANRDRMRQHQIPPPKNH